MYVLSANSITHRPAAYHDALGSFPLIAGRKLNWDLQQDEIQVKAAVLTLLLPTEDNKLAEQAPNEIHYVPVPEGREAFVRGQDASYHATAAELKAR
jgi:hypothetical protein